MLTKTKALEILGDLTDIGVNVALVAIADPAYDGRSQAEGEVAYAIELNRNANLTIDRITEVNKALAPHDATIEFPSMTVVTHEFVAEREKRNEVLRDPNAGGGTEETLGKVEQGVDPSDLQTDPNEAPQAQPAETREPSPPQD